MRWRARCSGGSGIGTLDSSASVYGCSGDSYSECSRRDLDQLAGVQDRDPVRDVPHHRQVVGDEQVGEPELGLQVLQQVDDLGADRHVERRHRFVGDDEVGPQRQRPGDADALALAATERVGVAIDGVDGQPAAIEQVASTVGRACSLSLASPWTMSGSATSCSTVLRGLRLA